MKIEISGETITITPNGGLRGGPFQIHCATPRDAQLTAARAALGYEGWKVRGLASTDGNRRPLILPGEAMMAPLDGARSDERAQGFAASRDGAALTIDACAGLPVLVTVERGDTAEARAIIARYLPLDGEPTP